MSKRVSSSKLFFYDLYGDGVKVQVISGARYQLQWLDQDDEIGISDISCMFSHYTIVRFLYYLSSITKIQVISSLLSLC